MIAGKKNPAQWRMVGHFRQRLPADFRRGRFRVERIAGQQDHAGIMLARRGGQSAKRGMARFTQSATKIFSHIAETLAEMEVAAVNESKHQTSAEWRELGNEGCLRLISTLSEKGHRPYRSGGLYKSAVLALKSLSGTRGYLRNVRRLQRLQPLLGTPDGCGP